MTNLEELFITLQPNKENINYELLSFLMRNKDTTDSVYSAYREFDNPFRTDELFHEEEQFETDANEVPTRNGAWSYNNHNNYDYEYSIIDGNKLLVIESKQSIEGCVGDPRYTRFILHPNAQQMVIKRTPGHREVPYMTIEDESRQMVSNFFFEHPRRKAENYEDGTKVTEVLKSVSLEELVTRYQESENKKESQKNPRIH